MANNCVCLECKHVGPVQKKSRLLHVVGALLLLCLIPPLGLVAIIVLGFYKPSLQCSGCGSKAVIDQASGKKKGIGLMFGGWIGGD